MARMNTTKPKARRIVPDTVNHEGSPSYSMDSLSTIFSKVMGSFFGESTFYEDRSAEEDMNTLIDLVNNVEDEDLEYVLKIAALGRKFGMIQYPLALLSVCFNNGRCKGGNVPLQLYADDVIKRARDVVDLMAMQIMTYDFNNRKESPRVRHEAPETFYEKGMGSGRPLPIQLRKALVRKLESFDEYQLSKAASEAREVSLADCIKLLHPSERRNKKLSRGFFRKIIQGNVTFGNGKKQVQTALSSKNTDDLKESIQDSSYQALLKNLNAMLDKGIFDSDRSTLKQIVLRLTDPDAIAKSRMLPFRFYSAYHAIGSPNFTWTPGRTFAATSLKDALSRALDFSCMNAGFLGGRSAVVIDRSGSMHNNHVSEKSEVTCEEVALLLGAMMYKSGLGDVFVFSEMGKKVTGLNRDMSVLELMEAIRKNHVGNGATYLQFAIEEVMKSAMNGGTYDQFILLSDGDCYEKSFHDDSPVWKNSLFDTYIKQAMQQKAFKRLYLNNLCGNDFSIVPFEDNRCKLISGYTEKVLSFIKFYQDHTDRAAVKDLIDAMIVDHF